MKTGNRRKNKKYKFNVKKLIRNIFYFLMIIFFVYVVIDRCGDINGIDFFFTTWN